MWVNWSGGQRCVPAASERPSSRAEVVDAVGRAAAAGRRIRVAGEGHSFSDAVMTDGTLLRCDRLDRVLDADPASGLVRVEGAITLARLNAELAARGLALANLGDIDAQSLAGALATGTHGTGGRLPNLSADVEAMELVLADGSERTLTRADGDLLRAARVGLGALGVVVAVPCAASRRSGCTPWTSPSPWTPCSQSSTSGWTAPTTSSCGPSRARGGRSPAPTGAPGSRRDRPAPRDGGSTRCSSRTTRSAPSTARGGGCRGRSGS